MFKSPGVHITEAIFSFDKTEWNRHKTGIQVGDLVTSSQFGMEEYTRIKEYDDRGLGDFSSLLEGYERRMGLGLVVKKFPLEYSIGTIYRMLSVKWLFCNFLEKRIDTRYLKKVDNV